MPAPIATDIEITASPETVRAKFLDFPSIAKYSPDGFIKSITPIVPGKSMEPGDLLDVQLKGTAFKPVLIENTPQIFSWKGSFAGLFVGTHYFHFQPSQKTPGHTTLAHGENFGGALGFIIGENALAKMMGFREETANGFEGFNKDFKAWVESS
ncbi:hypothetical protein ACMFMG_002636 [Clarireedia jacksonii]